MDDLREQGEEARPLRWSPLIIGILVLACVVFLLAGCTRTIYVPGPSVDKAVPIYCKPVIVPVYRSYVVHDQKATSTAVGAGLIASLRERKSQVKLLRGALKKCEGK